jgi:AraC-like DNA-binding protein
MHLINFAQQRGVDLQDFAAVEVSSTGLIPFSHYARAMERLLEATDDDNLGWHLGEQYNLVALGIVGQIIQASATIGEGLDRCLESFALITDALIIEHQLDVDSMVLRFKMSPTCVVKFPVAGRHFLHTAMLAAFRELSFLTLGRWEPLGIGLANQEHCPEALKANFNCPIVFSAQGNYLRFDRSVLAERIIYADYQLLVCLEKVACQRLQELRSGGQHFTDLIREVVWSMVNPELPSVKRLADHLNISERQLQRQLHREGTSYREIMQSMKKELAATYLEQNMSVKEVGYTLGYSSPGAFIKSFKKWYGVSPLRFRKAQDLSLGKG